MLFPITSFPIAILDGITLSVLYAPTSLVGADGIVHHASVWGAWSAEDWARHRPNWRHLDIVDVPPVVTLAQTYERLPAEGWAVDRDAGTATVAYRVFDRDPAELALAAALVEAATIKARADAVQRYLDTAAQARGYDSIATLVTYADEPAVGKFQVEGRAARAWRSAVWARCYALLDEVKAGTREPLTDVELIAELPSLDWPDPTF